MNPNMNQRQQLDSLRSVYQRSSIHTIGTGEEAMEVAITGRDQCAASVLAEKAILEVMTEKERHKKRTRSRRTKVCTKRGASGLHLAFALQSANADFDLEKATEQRNKSKKDFEAKNKVLQGVQDHVKKYQRNQYWNIADPLLRVTGPTTVSYKHLRLPTI